jgi:hypothetical protein
MMKANAAKLGQTTIPNDGTPIHASKLPCTGNEKELTCDISPILIDIKIVITK